MENEKRIALLNEGNVFNVIVGPSEAEMASLFNCEAKEVTSETGQAHVGYAFTNGQFEQPPYVEEEILEPPVVKEEILEG